MARFSGSFVFARNIRYGYFSLQHEVRQGSLLRRFLQIQETIRLLVFDKPGRARHFQLQSSQASLDEPASLHIEMIRKPLGLIFNGPRTKGFYERILAFGFVSLSLSSPN